MIKIKLIKTKRRIISLIACLCFLCSIITSESTHVEAATSDMKNVSWNFAFPLSYPRDGTYGTSVVSHNIYSNRRIYIQLDIWTRGTKGYDNVWVAKNGQVIRTWCMPRASRTDQYNPTTSPYNKWDGYGYTWYRRGTEYIETDGARPDKPSCAFIFDVNNRKATLDVTSRANRCTSLTYDYVYTGTSGSSFVPGDGASPYALDYVSRFFWNVDTTAFSFPYYTDSSTIDLSNTLPLDGKQHVVRYLAQSYTGQNSDVSSITINEITINYDKNGDFAQGSMNPAYWIHGNNCKIANSGYTADGYSFVGWNTKADGSGTMYKAGDVVNASNLASANGSCTLYAQWDKPTATVEPTENNTSFTNNDVTYYKDPVEFEVKGTDKYFPINGVSIWTDKDNIRIDCKGSSYTKTYDKTYCVEPDIITVYGQSRTESGISEVVSKDVHIDVTPPEITKCVVDYGQGKVNIGSTDSQSGIGNIKLEYLKDGTWYTENEYETKETEYDECDISLDTTSEYFKYIHRIVVTDHLGNSAYSSEFYVVPLTLTSSLSKLNGDTAYNNQTLTYLAGGDLNAYLNVKITGYPDSVKYEFANELGQPVDEHVVTYDANGEVVESKQFVIPWQIEHDKDYYVKVTAYRGNESISTTEYVKLVDIDFSIFKSVILYQSGQHD